MLIQVNYPWQVNSISLLTHHEEVVEMEIEAQVSLWVMVNIMSIALVVDGVVPMTPQVVVMLVHLMIHMESV